MVPLEAAARRLSIPMADLLARLADHGIAVVGFRKSARITEADIARVMASRELIASTPRAVPTLLTVRRLVRSIDPNQRVMPFRPKSKRLGSAG